MDGRRDAPGRGPATAVTRDDGPRGDAEDATARAPHAAREHYIDWLRAAGVLAVVVIHLCQPFNPWDEWHVTSAARSRVIGTVVVVLAPWIMPLLMLLGGASACYALDRRTNRAYLRERVVRVLVPLGVGVLVLVPPQVYVERRLRGQFHGSFAEFFPHFFDGIYPRGNFAWHHLWFLAHLFAYSVITLPLFRYLRSPSGSGWLRRLAAWCGGRAGLLWLVVPLVGERLIMWWIAPDRALLTGALGDWSNRALLLPAFVLGYLFAAEPGLVADVDQQWRRALGSALGGTAAVVAAAWAGLLPGGLPPARSIAYATFWVLYGWLAWAWVVATLGAARRYLRADAPFVRYARSAAYPWYLLHQTVIVVAAYWVLQLRTSVGVQYVILAVTALALTAGGTELAMRWSVTRRLIGLPAERPPVGAPPRR